MGEIKSAYNARIWKERKKERIWKTKQNLKLNTDFVIWAILKRFYFGLGNKNETRKYHNSKRMFLIKRPNKIYPQTLWLLTYNFYSFSLLIYFRFTSYLYTSVNLCVSLLDAIFKSYVRKYFFISLRAYHLSKMLLFLFLFYELIKFL